MLRLPDLSLTIVKLLVRGAWRSCRAKTPPGHFGFAVRDNASSTAPTRCYPDLITQRLLKGAITAAPVLYGEDKLGWLARHYTQQEDAASKVERRVRESTAALFFSERLGESFDAFVTGAAERGTWVRILDPPFEGKLIAGTEALDVGHRLRVKLVSVDVDRGYIDFVRD